MTAWKARARQLKTSTYAVYLAYRDPRTPWHARLVAMGVVAYAFSPIDLIPDFIPILGYLDDLVIVPLGILLAVRLIPRDVWSDCQQRAQHAMQDDHPANWIAAGVIVCIWTALALGGLALVVRALDG